MSNYLLAFGKKERIRRIQYWFRDSSELSVVDFDNGFSLISVSKAETIIKSNRTHIFFTGWIQDHESQSVVFGGKGYNEWASSKTNTNLENEPEGAYVLARYENGALTIQNDMFSLFPVIYFAEKDFFVCSDSLYMLSALRKYFALPCKINKNVMHTRAWTHGLACSVMSNQTQIEDVYILSPGKHIFLQ